MDDNLFVVLNNKVIASWHIIKLFHEVASRGVKPTQENVKLRARGLLNELDPLTKQFSSRLEPDYENQIAEEIASSAALTAESVISATSIVLAHAVLDDLVSELCLSSSKLEPELWVDAIEARKIDFKCAAERPLTEIRQELIEAGKTARSPESSCDAQAHRASTGEDGSQENPPCDPNPKPSRRPDRHYCSIRRASGLVQTPISYHR